MTTYTIQINKTDSEFYELLIHAVCNPLFRGETKKSTRARVVSLIHGDDLDVQLKDSIEENGSVEVSFKETI